MKEAARDSASGSLLGLGEKGFLPCGMNPTPESCPAFSRALSVAITFASVQPTDRNALPRSLLFTDHILCGEAQLPLPLSVSGNWPS